MCVCVCVCVRNNIGESSSLLLCSSACAPSLKLNLITVHICMILCLSGISFWL